MLFVDDAAVVAHSQEHLQTLIDQFTQACQDFSLTISINKTKMIGQATKNPPSITIISYTLEAVNTFTYLGSTITDNLSLDTELSCRIGKAASTFGKLTARVWDNSKLTIRTKVQVYRACVISTLMYGSETWTLYSHQERRLNNFYLRCLRRIPSITWSDRITNTSVLGRAQLPSLYSLLRQRRLRWLGHVRRMDDGRIPKDILYGELTSGKRQIGHPQLRFKDVCKKDLRCFGIAPSSCENLAQDRHRWRQNLHRRLYMS